MNILTKIISLFSSVVLSLSFFSCPENEINQIRSIINTNLQAEELPVIGSFDSFKEILEKAREKHGYYHRFSTGGEFSIISESVNVTVQAEGGKAKNSNFAGNAGEDYSKTNLQVEGVDEGDIVKTDGEYIYQVNRRRVVVLKAYPAENMEVVGSVKFTDEKFNPREIYLYDSRLIVIGSSYSEIQVPFDSGREKDRIPKLLPRYFPGLLNTVKAIVFDISEKSDVKELRSIELEGGLVSSRKIGSTLYLIANKYVDYYYIQKWGEDSGFLKPSYRDSISGEDFVDIDYSQIKYFPDIVDTNYMIVGAVDLDKTDKEINVNTYLGVSQNIYASANNLYAAVTRFEDDTKNGETGSESDKTGPGGSDANITPVPGQITENTLVYKFGLSGDKVKYINKGKVPGRILNQFSMDEHNGYFRIATTKGSIWGEGENESKNNVYMLDNNMDITGKIENIAPGEKIYSVRFMGDRGYIVTFKTVDPLFVIDLKDPYKPEILGALKIPGYSDYLHPYDENHIIGFGKDTVEVKGMAYYLGMKLAVFDVSDVKNPRQKFSEIIGYRGTHSEILNNHKALLFSRDKDILAFPVTVMEAADGKTELEGSQLPAYGRFEFQGAYIYGLDLETGLNLKAKITHLSDQDYMKAGMHSFDHNFSVQRIMYIKDTLYTLSNGKIKANDMEDFKEINSIKIP